MSSRARKIANLKKEAASAIKEVKDEIKQTEPQVSTAISDAVLALASFGCAFMNLNTFIGYFGFLIIGLAAFIGVFKFSGLHQLNLFHKLASLFYGFMTHLKIGCHFRNSITVFQSITIFVLTLYVSSIAATTIGVPLMGIAFLHFEKDMLTLKLSVYFAITFCLAAAFFYYLKFNGWQTLAPLIGIICAIAGSVLTSQYLGIAGAVLYVVSGLAIGTEGKIGSLKRVDLFHYGLAASNLMLGFALRHVLTIYALSKRL